MKLWIARIAAGIAAAVALAWVPASPVSAQDGKELFISKGCPTCHGPDGGTTIAPNYPKLKGQNADYIAVQLKAFRSGERKGPQVALMSPMALTLTDQESDLIAKYLQDVK
jgi:cytochrome c